MTILASHYHYHSGPFALFALFALFAIFIVYFSLYSGGNRKD